MDSAHAIPHALRRIAEILASETGYSKHVSDIEGLLVMATSDNLDDQRSFRKEITTNKWYWLGMGTIADISFEDRAKNHAFMAAYYDLAVACDAEGLGSVYSRDVQDVFGKWLREGHV